MERQAEVAAPYARLVLQAGIVSPDKLLQGTELSEAAVGAMEFISASDLTVLFRNYDQHVNDPAWTAKLGAQLHVTAHGPLGFAALSAPTLGDALEVMSDFQASRNTAMTATSVTTDTRYRLQLNSTVEDADFGQWLSEIIMKVVEALLASILGHAVGKNVTISFTRPAPRHAEALAGCYDSTVLFGQQYNAIEVPIAWRQLPSPLYDEAVYRANLIKCRDMINAREGSGSVALTVRHHLSNHFDSQSLSGTAAGPPPTLEQMAARLHTTPRTLIRRLQREDTSYKQILETLRCEYAERLLCDARLTAANVGAILGYGEAANFGRAFRRWYGQSPAAWRRSSRS